MKAKKSYSTSFCIVFLFLHNFVVIASETAEDIRALEAQSQCLQQDGNIFESKSQQINRQAWKELIKSKLFLYILALIIFIFIGLIVYFGIIKPSE